MGLSAVAHYHDEGYALTDRWERCRDSACEKPAWDRWICTKRLKVRNEPRYEVCKAVYWYRRPFPSTAGGPTDRMVDRRYGYGAHYRCKHEGRGVLKHESAPDPEQPIQDDLLYEQVERLKVIAKEARKKRGRKKVQPA